MFHLLNKLRLNVLTTIALLAFMLCNSSYAVESNVVATENVKARFLSQYSEVEVGQSFYVLFEIDIRDGWHTYWRNPGDSGQATSIKWTLPQGVTAEEIQWPYPERQYVGPVANYGYHGTALHRVKLNVSQDYTSEQPILIQANATWLVCEEECIPEKGLFRFELPLADKAVVAAANQSSFSRFDEILPKPLKVESGYQYASASGDSEEQIRFEFAPAQELLSASKIEYFPHDWGVLQPPAEQTVVQDSQFVSISTLKGDLRFKKPLKGVLVTWDVNGETDAYQVESKFGALNINAGLHQITQNQAGQSQTIQTEEVGLLSALLLALLGGLILNLMPCVFPVLSMKALSLVHQADQPPAVIRRHGIVYTLGILISFAVLGVALIMIKAAGHHIGWGFQLQAPLFVAAIVVVIFVLGLSLSGFVEIGASLMGAGSGLAQQKGYKGSFFTGVLAVIVATPCTAPFMGPAVGFALTQTPLITVLVLLALGLGLALPYLLLSFVPVLSRYLPKPGLWMKKFQQFLAFPMFATTAWLVWVFGLQTDMGQVFNLLIICILITLVIWLWQNVREQSYWRTISRGFALLTLLVAASFAWKIAGSSNDTKEIFDTGLTEEAVNYENFSLERLQQLRKSNSPVFVNMTAAWCITCLANEKVALSKPQLKTFFADNNITYLKGDWTNQDAVITSYLESFSRSSVPLYVYYPRGSASQPQVLPQILTVAGVMEFIKSADQ